MAAAQGWSALDAGSGALEGDVSGLLYARYNLDLRDDRAFEDLQESRAKAWIEAHVERPGSWQATVSALGEHVYYPDRGDADFVPRLWEAWGDWETDRWSLRVGQQIRRWGRGVPSLLDVLNPSDLSEALFVEDEFQKLPVPMARWTRFGERYELEAVWIPFYRGARMARNDSDWAPISVRDLAGAEDIPLLAEAVEADLQPGIVTQPADDLLASEFGLRFSPRLRSWDVDLIGFWGHEDLPPPVFSSAFRGFLAAEAANGNPVPDTLRSLSVAEIVVFNPMYVQQPTRQLMLGMGLSRPLHGVTVRVELLGVSSVGIYNERLQRIRVPGLSLNAGVDALSGERFLYSLTLINQNFLTDERLFILDPVNVSAMGLMRVKPFSIDFWLEARGLWNLSLGDAWIGPAVIWSAAAGLELQAGVHVLGGPAPTPLSQLDGNDFAWARVKYAF